jgi:hypothetical protein
MNGCNAFFAGGNPQQQQPQPSPSVSVGMGTQHTANQHMLYQPQPAQQAQPTQATMGVPVMTPNPLAGKLDPTAVEAQAALGMYLMQRHGQIQGQNVKTPKPIAPTPAAPAELANPASSDEYEQFKAYQALRDRFS